MLRQVPADEHRHIPLDLSVVHGNKTFQGRIGKLWGLHPFLRGTASGLRHRFSRPSRRP